MSDMDPHPGTFVNISPNTSYQASHCNLEAGFEFAKQFDVSEA
ncbi:hypothetical protein AGR1C_Cc70039 [Agrobacterium fabacearum TT111]|nr:hypothetical protein AGR1C_Cc70039 [Agrobacterium fabacearum TT111]